MAEQLQTIGLDRVFHGLADPSRLEMVERLSSGPASVKELAEPFSMALPSVMKHLKVLESIGIVRSEKRGRVRTYRLERGPLSHIESWVTRRMAAWNRSFDRLEGLFEAEGPGKEGG